MAAESSAAGSMRKAPSMEWRWVSAGEEEEGEEEDGGRGAGGPAAVGAVGRGGSFESEDEDDYRDDDDDDDDDNEQEQEEARQRLIRTGPSVNWFDVEGNEVSVPQPLEDYEVSGRPSSGLVLPDSLPAMLVVALCCIGGHVCPTDAVYAAIALAVRVQSQGVGITRRWFDYSRLVPLDWNYDQKEI